MKRPYQTKEELKRAGFHLRNSNPKSYMKIDKDRITIYEVLPQPYRLIFDGEISRFQERESRLEKEVGGKK